MVDGQAELSAFSLQQQEPIEIKQRIRKERLVSQLVQLAGKSQQIRFYRILLPGGR